MNPIKDVQVVPHRGQGHGPKREHDQEEDSTLLMDATMKADMPPLALPKKEFMERAKTIWQELGFDSLQPQPPWFGYSLGDWLPQWDEAAMRAAQGGYLDNGRISEKQRRKGLKPETKFRPGKDNGKA
jgi:4-hydroxy-3-polyprenylbenzoate decarboxylase